MKSLHNLTFHLKSCLLSTPVWQRRQINVWANAVCSGKGTAVALLKVKEDIEQEGETHPLLLYPRSTTI